MCERRLHDMISIISGFKRLFFSSEYGVKFFWDRNAKLISANTVDLKTVNCSII
jgi:hypothetical protein